MKTRIIDNRNRPAQPEPGEDPAVERVPVREEARKVLGRKKKTTATPSKGTRRKAR